MMLQAECSRLRIENGRMEKSLHLREQNLLKERATNKKLSADLEAKTQESFEHAQEAHYLSRQLKYSQEDCEYLRISRMFGVLCRERFLAVILGSQALHVAFKV